MDYGMFIRSVLENGSYYLAQAEEAVCREVDLADVPDMITVIIGMRRVGKTTVLFQKMRERYLAGTPMERLLYINFEDERLLPMTPQDLGELLTAYYSVFPEFYDEKVTFFLDEIQNVPGFETVLRRFLDSRNVDIFVTGSSAKLLSKDIATSLRGRARTIELWPFSFSEYLAFRDETLPVMMGEKGFQIYKKQLLDYLTWGGFPALQALGERDRVAILQDYVGVVVLRDILDRYQLRQGTLLKYLVKSLVQNIGSAFSINKFYKDVSSQGYSVAKDSLYDYVDYLEDAYLCFLLPLYSQSLRKVYSNPKKAYVIDTGVVGSYQLQMDKNMGHKFENLVYLDLRRWGYTVHYYLSEARYEVDFLAVPKLGAPILIQVAFDVDDPETLMRETRALEAAKAELGYEGYLLTPDNYLDFLKEFS